MRTLTHEQTVAGISSCFGTTVCLVSHHVILGAVTSRSRRVADIDVVTL
jgi:hypothetical protein